MTSEETKEIFERIKYEHTSNSGTKDSTAKACDMATRSLEAWDEVMKDVQDWQEDFNTHVKLLKLTDEEKERTMMYGEDVVNILGNHMVELKEAQE